MLKRKTYINLIVIFLLAVLGFAIVSPRYFNRGIDYINNFQFSIFNFQLIKIPYFPEIPFKLGLDLQGGSRLIYQADLSQIEEKERGDSMEGLRDVIERRVNIFGVHEPIVHLEEKGEQKRLIVELPGVKNVKEAIEMLGKTPYLEFKEERSEEEREEILKKEEGEIILEDPYFKPTKLTGKYLKKSQLSFNQTTFEPEVLLEFNSEGAEIFKELTQKNVEKRLAIYIDNVLISAPVVREVISGGKAQITGKFTLEEARELARNLSAGALPAPIKLISQETVGPTLGKISLEKSLKAGIFGFLAVCLFMLLIYRLSGLVASLALLIYALILLSLFKLVPVTLTLAGIGGAVLSIGMAVDANVLIFERFKEERRTSEVFSRAWNIGFSRAWPSIRDSNFTTLIVALIMFSFGTSFIKGFALTLSLGILTSMFSALFVSRTFLKAFVGTRFERFKWLWG
ncbi:MAG: protein translocase subunit SecD [Patescibacteria group bacterium]|nr:protein translocase subunit SecD [Patescibacteria group bacterium]